MHVTVPALPYRKEYSDCHPDQRSVEEGTLTRQDPVLSPKTLYRTAAPPSGYETENSTHYLKMASSELSSFIAISLIIKTTYRCHLTVK